MNRKTLFHVSVCFLLFANQGLAISPGETEFLRLIDRQDDAKVIPLWPGDGTPPNAVEIAAEESIQLSKAGKAGIRNVSRPSMVVVPPPSNSESNGVTMLFAPGGGYGGLSLPNAQNLCEWSHAVGAHFVMLKYRVPRATDDPGHRIPLSDAQRAMRLLRSQAGELEIDRDKIIMVGSSAGGHLAFNLSNNADEATYTAIDETDTLNAKPNATLLLYPAYLTKPTTSLDEDPHLNLDRLSPTTTPPIFMTVTRPDKFVWGAINTMLRLRKAKVPSELHVYPEGGHGGTFDKYPFMDFVRPAARFMRDQGLFTDKMKSRSDAWIDQLESSVLNRDVTSPFVAAKETESVTPGSEPADGALSSDQLSVGDRQLARLQQNSAGVFPLWPGSGKRDDDPGAELDETIPDRGDEITRISNVTRPTIHHWPAENGDGRAVLVFPGGGYGILAAEHEGTEIAKWLNSQGVTAFVVKYRVPRRNGLEKHSVALQDAQRAIRLVRSRAAEFGLSPDKIGVLGFSAGGHLATLTAHHHDQDTYVPVDAADETSARPDFAILIYPAYLAKDNEDRELDSTIQPLASPSDYPRTYLAVAADDKFAPGSIHYLLHLHQMNVPGELHVYASGGHGKGLRESGGPFAQWTRDCQRWMDDLKHDTENVLIE
tara:strand:- start:112103 stop:114067 length:1965 start_codon:yes stop_codon:yes gene_type:complete